MSKNTRQRNLFSYSKCFIRLASDEKKWRRLNLPAAWPRRGRLPRRWVWRRRLTSRWVVWSPWRCRRAPLGGWWAGNEGAWLEYPEWGEPRVEPQRGSARPVSLERCPRRSEPHPRTGSRPPSSWRPSAAVRTPSGLENHGIQLSTNRKFEPTLGTISINLSMIKKAFGQQSIMTLKIFLWKDNRQNQTLAPIRSC